MTNKINGIHVSEEIRYCNNCSNLGLDFKTGKFYCGLSNRKDELPEILSCENFSSSCYIKCLQQENKKLKNKNNDLIEEIASGNIDIAILQKENEELKKKIESYNCNANCYKYKETDKYKQALEEIRGIAKNACDSSVCHYNCKQCSDGKIIEKINEVLKNET